MLGTYFADEPHSESFGSEDYRQFAWGVFRTYCAARGTWHLYILFNEMLDESIAKIARDFQPIPVSDKERSVIAVTGYFLKNLAVEDPFVRAVGLTPMPYRNSTDKSEVWSGEKKDRG